MPRWPTGPFSTHRTGCYGCVRYTSEDGACGVHGYPCVHWGADLFAADPNVFAPDSGVIVAVSDGNSAPWVGYGPGVVVMKGDSGQFLLMGHLNPSTIDVSVGDQVVEGQPIAVFDADIGHTHFEVRKQLTGPSDVNTIDPSSWVGGLPRKIVIGVGLGLVAWWITRWWTSPSSA